MDLDTIHEARVDALGKKLREHGEYRHEDLFLHQRVVETIGKEKVLIDSFKPKRLLPILPFSPVVYVQTCPACISARSFPTFSRLIDAGLVIPILTAPYRDYPSAVVSQLAKRDHISCYEFDFYRTTSILSGDSSDAICTCCTLSRLENIQDLARGKRHAAAYRDGIESIFSLTSPALERDTELFNLAEEAVRCRDLASLQQLENLAWSLRFARTAQSFDAAVTIRSRSIEMIPPALIDQKGVTQQTVSDLRAQMAEGLGLTIPLNMPIDAYIELVKDLQDQIRSVIAPEIDTSRHADVTIFSAKICSRITDINRHVDRWKRSKSYDLYEVGMGFVRNKGKDVAASILTAGTLGVAATLLGCGPIGAGITAAIGGTKTARTVLKAARSRISPADAQTDVTRLPKVAELTRKVQLSLQPMLDGLIARYAGVERPAVRVLSIQRYIEQSTAASAADAH